MRFDEIVKGMRGEKSFNLKAMSELLSAVTRGYSMIMMTNVTKNYYVVLKEEHFWANKFPMMGEYDSMITASEENAHPHYMEFFRRTFDRQEVIKRYENGDRWMTAKIYHKDLEGGYYWVESTMYWEKDESGDIIQICLNRPIGGMER